MIQLLGVHNFLFFKNFPLMDDKHIDIIQSHSTDSTAVIYGHTLPIARPGDSLLAASEDHHAFG